MGRSVSQNPSIPWDSEAYLRVHHNPNSFNSIRRFIKVYMADPIRMAHDGNPSVVLDVLDEAVRAPRDDQVDVLVELEEGGDFGAGLDRLDKLCWDLGLG